MPAHTVFVATGSPQVGETTEQTLRFLASIKQGLRKKGVELTVVNVPISLLTRPVRAALKQKGVSDLPALRVRGEQGAFMKFSGIKSAYEKFLGPGPKKPATPQASVEAFYDREMFSKDTDDDEFGEGTADLDQRIRSIQTSRQASAATRPRGRRPAFGGSNAPSGAAPRGDNVSSSQGSVDRILGEFSDAPGKKLAEAPNESADDVMLRNYLDNQ